MVSNVKIHRRFCSQLPYLQPMRPKFTFEQLGKYKNQNILTFYHNVFRKGYIKLQ